MDRKVDVLRDTLSHQLDEACTFIVEISNAAKRMDGLRMLLYSKRDVAIDKLNHVFLVAEETLTKLKNNLEGQINHSSTEKIELITIERDSLKKVIRDTAMSCTQIEEMLVIGQEEQLTREGNRLAQKMRKLMSVKHQNIVEDTNYLEFVPNSDCKKELDFTELLGYVRCTELDPNKVKLSPLHKAVVSVEENIIIQTNVEKSDCLKYISVKIQDPKCDLLDISVECCKRDGEYKVVFVPQQPGEHILEVLVYGRNIPGSPFIIKVDNTVGGLTNRRTKPGNRVKCSRNTLQAMADHIKTNPDINQQVADAMIKEDLPCDGYAFNFAKEQKENLDYEKTDKRFPVNLNYDEHCVRKNLSSDKSFQEYRDHTLHNMKPKINFSPAKNKQEVYSPPQAGEPNMYFSPVKIKQEVFSPIRPVDPYVNHANIGMKEEQNKRQVLLEDSTKLKHSKNKPTQSADYNRFCKQAGVIIKQEVVDDWESEVCQGVVISDVKLHSSRQSPERKNIELTSIWQEKKNFKNSEKKTLSGKYNDSILKSNFRKESDCNNTHKSDNKQFLEKYQSPFKKNLEKQMNKTKYNEDKITGTFKNESDSSRNYSKADCKLGKEFGKESDHFFRMGLDKNTKDNSAQFGSSASNLFTKSYHGKDSNVNRYDESSKKSSDQCETIWEGAGHFPVTKHKNSQCEVSKIDFTRKSMLHDFKKDENNNSNKGKTTGNSSDAANSVSSEQYSGSLVQEKKCSMSVIEESLKQGYSVIKTSLIRIIGHQGSDSGSTNFPIGVSVTPDNHIIVCDNGQDAVRIFTWGGQVKRSLGSGNFKRPSAVVTNEWGDIFIKDSNAIHLFNKMGTYIRHFGSDVLKKPFGLALNKDSHLVMINYLWDRVMLVNYDQKGKLLKNTEFKPITKDLIKASKCRFLATHGDKIAVSDLGVNKIFVTDMNGYPMYEFGTRGCQPGYFIEPSGVRFDCCGNLVVADSKNDRIQVFKEDGTYLSQIDVGRIRRPSDIHLTKDGCIVVSNLLGHCAKLFKIEHPQKK